MTHSEDATKSWVKATPQVNSDGNVTEWICHYNYTLGGYSHTFDERVLIEVPSKAPGAYTKAELLIMIREYHMDDMFNKKYHAHVTPAPVLTRDNTFDVNTLGD